MVTLRPPEFFARLSRPQNTSSPSFQVPSCRTADPGMARATGFPPARRLYVTAALVAEVYLRVATSPAIDAAIGLAVKAPIAEVNLEPSCSSARRWGMGVLALKNFTQA